MNDLITNFKNLCTLDITLPDGGPVSVEKLNINFQNKLFTTIQDSTNDITITLKYISFFNNHIQNLNNDIQITYTDKLYLLGHWRDELSNTNELQNYNFDDVTLDKPITIPINNTDIVITFTLPTISQENDILEVLLNKENNTDADLIFFDNFRFLESITISEKKYIINNITTHELYELYLLFDINNIQKISDHINKQLGDLTSIRSQEADFSFFIDL